VAVAEVDEAAPRRRPRAAVDTEAPAASGGGVGESAPPRRDGVSRGEARGQSLGCGSSYVARPRSSRGAVSVSLTACLLPHRKAVARAAARAAQAGDTKNSKWRVRLCLATL
jgi:hypothetical protein